MAKYRKKPVVVEAFQMTRENKMNPESWPEWLRKARRKWSWRKGAIWQRLGDPDGILICGTHEDGRGVEIDWGDWIIREADGEIYPCKDEIFRETYEIVE